MAEITMELIKQLREKTSVGMMDCKNALNEANGDMDKAVEILRKKGAAVAAKRADNSTDHGIVAAHVTADHHTGALVEISCETDFAANTDALKNFINALANHITVNADATDAAAVAGQKLTDSSFTVTEALEEVMSKISENTKIGRIARYATDNNGLVHAYIHPGATLGVLVEIAAQGDVSAHAAKLAQMARDFCMQIAVTNPLCVRSEELDPAIVNKEKALITEQLAASGKPAAMIEKITAGKLDKYYEEVCLLNQKFIKDDKLKVADVCSNVGKEIGVTLTVKRFARFTVGK